MLCFRIDGYVLRHSGTINHFYPLFKTRGLSECLFRDNCDIFTTVFFLFSGRKKHRMLLVTQLCRTDLHVFYMRNAWKVRHSWVKTWIDWNDDRFVTGLSMWLSNLVSRFLSSCGNESLHVGWMIQTAEMSETHSRMNLATVFSLDTYPDTVLVSSQDPFAQWSFYVACHTWRQRGLASICRGGHFVFCSPPL